MQPRGVEKYGSVYVVRIRWDRPNRYARVEVVG